MQETPAARLADIHCLLGQCLLGVQSCEVVLKAILTSQKVTWPPPPVASQGDRRTLGVLVDGLFSTFLVTGDWPDSPQDGPPFTIRFGIRLSSDESDRLRDGLRTFVTMRNTLVHHFIQEHDLHSAEGRSAAEKDLTDRLARIRQYFEMFRSWGDAIDTARMEAAKHILRIKW